MGWIQGLLSSRRAQASIVVAALVLTLPTLTLGFMLDDYSHRLMLDRSFEFPGGQRAVWDLFRFQDESRDTFHVLQTAGIAPWWTSADFRLAFFRPLTSLLHAMDYTFFPANAVLMHLENVALYVAMVSIVAALYRRVIGATWVAALAALMFAIDDAHGFVVAWIANRNALLASALGFGALLAHARARGVAAAGSVDADARGTKTEAKWSALAPILFALALLAGESSLAALVYVVAYAIWLDDAPLRSRVVSLVPYACIVVAWFAAYRSIGYGAQGGGFYIDPLRERGAYALAVIERAPVLLLAQFAVPPSEFWFLVPQRHVLLASLVVAAIVAFGGVVVWKVVGRDRKARFFATGMVLSTFPLCATWPSDRLLIAVGFGAFGLIALFLAEARAVAGRLRFVTRPLALSFVVLHLVIGPLLLPIREVQAGPLFKRPIERGAETLHSPGRPDDTTYVILNAPNALFPLFSVTKRVVDTGAKGPVSVRLLGVTIDGTLEVERVDDRSLALEFSDGFPHDPLSRFFRGAPFRSGEEIDVVGLHVRVESVNADGEAVRVLFRFDRPLDDPRLAWFVWEKTGFVPYRPPAIGSRDRRAAITLREAGGQ